MSISDWTTVVGWIRCLSVAPISMSFVSNWKIISEASTRWWWWRLSALFLYIKLNKLEKPNNDSTAVFLWARTRKLAGDVRPNIFEFSEASTTTIPASFTKNTVILHNFTVILHNFSVFHNKHCYSSRKRGVHPLTDMFCLKKMRIWGTSLNGRSLLVGFSNPSLISCSSCIHVEI